MADRWRRQTLASWDVLLDFDHATIATYAYLATGPAATKTGCVRIHRRRLRRELSLKGIQVDSALADLVQGELVAMSSKGDVLTIYLRGMLVECPPANPNTRRGYVRELLGLGECDATKSALLDLASTGKTDLQLIEHTGNSLSTLGQQSANVVGHKRLDQTRLDQTKEDQNTPTGNTTAQARDTAPKEADVKDEGHLKTRPGLQANHKAEAVLDAYRKICVPAGMSDIRRPNGKYSAAMIKAARKAMVRTGRDFDWPEYFEHCATSPFLCGKVAPTNGRRRFRANFAYITGPDNQAKVESGAFDDTAPPVTAAPTKYTQEPEGWE